MTAPETRADGNARGLMVLAAAVVTGVLLLANVDAGGSSSSATQTEDVPAAPDVETGDSSTTIATTTTIAGRPASDLTVIVLNGSDKDGAAGAKTTELENEGYQTLPAGDAAALESTTVYYDVGFQPEGIALAQVIGLTPDRVLPLADASLGGAESTANLVVVLGADTPPVN